MIFSQLADATRVRLLCMLAKDELCVCEMSDLLGMSQPAVSHHLRGLREFGAIEFRKNGQRTLYSISESDEGKAVRLLLNVVGCGSVSCLTKKWLLTRNTTYADSIASSVSCKTEAKTGAGKTT
ncbi:MAG: metalloregulator ArsR/SmtB family transcription factor [Eubacteriales bacterium]